MAFSAQTGARPNIMQTSANLFNQAAQGPNIGAFQNPYQQQVVDTTMMDMNRAREMAVGQVGDQAMQAGAYGGSRHGVAEAETNRGYFDTMGRTMAGIRAAGFDSAVGNAFQNQQMQSQLAGQGFGFGMGLNQQQMQQGEMQRQMQQQLIDAARLQYQGFTGAPTSGVNLVNSAIGAIPGGGGTVQKSSSNPGLFGIMSALL